MAGLGVLAIIYPGLHLSPSSFTNLGPRPQPVRSTVFSLKDTISNGAIDYSPYGYPVSWNGWSLVGMPLGHKGGQMLGLLSPAGHIVLRGIRLGTEVALMPGPQGPIVAWTTQSGKLTWWYRGQEQSLSAPSGSMMSWSMTAAPDAPIVALEAYNRATGTAAWKAGSSGYHGPVIMRNLLTGAVIGRIPLPTQGLVPSPALLSSRGTEVLLGNLTLWTARGQELAIFHFSTPANPVLPALSVHSAIKSVRNRVLRLFPAPKPRASSRVSLRV